MIGVIRGSDPVLAAEAVVFSAHYDGFGVLRKAIYNGAADNAIGVGEMLAVAEAFARARVKPRRSLVFIAFTAEEYGLLGSKHYAAHPTWDLAKTAAVLNLDGIGTEIMGPMKGMVGLRRSVQLARPDVLRGRARVRHHADGRPDPGSRECSAAPTTIPSRSAACPA